jgi:hypothetical protein
VTAEQTAVAAECKGFNMEQSGGKEDGLNVRAGGGCGGGGNGGGGGRLGLGQDALEALDMEAHRHGNRRRRQQITAAAAAAA